MKITSIDLRMIQHDNAMRAIASIVLDNMIVIHDIKLIKKDHMFIAMPSRKIDKDDRFVDIVHPINQQTRNSIQQLLCDAYDLAMTMHCQYIVLMLKEECDLFEAHINDYMIVKTAGDIYEAT